MKRAAVGLSLALAYATPVAAKAQGGVPPSPAPGTPPPSSAPNVPPSSVPSPLASAPLATPPATSPATVPTLPQTTPPATPMATPTPLYRFVYRPTPIPTAAPDPNTPQIAEIDLSDSTVVTPGDVHVRVLTSYAVTNVIAQTLGRSVAIPRAAPGLFLLDTSVPGIPFFMSYLKNRTYPIVFSAAVSDGRATTVTLSLTLR